MPLALFGITNDGLNLAVNLLVLFLVVIWIALVVWTYLDARRRLDDSVLVGAATVASLFPFVGTIVYSILRPPEFLDDARERGLEIRASELRVRQLEEQSCPSCGFPIERTYLRCPSCRSRVKDPCESCGKPIDPRWALCPYCETPVRRQAAAAPAKRPSRGARAKAAAEGAPRRRERPDGERKEPPSERQKAPARSGPTQRSGTAQRPSRAAQQRQPAQPRPSDLLPESSARSAPAEAGGEERPRPATT